MKDFCSLILLTIPEERIIRWYRDHLLLGREAFGPHSAMLRAVPDSAQGSFLALLKGSNQSQLCTQ